MTRKVTAGRRSGLPAYAFLLVLCALFLAPQLIALSASFKTASEMFAAPLRLLPGEPTLAPWTELLTQYPVMRWLANTFLIALVGTLINLVLCSFAGYGFARLQFKGKQFLYKVVVMATMLPLAVYIVPLYFVMRELGIINGYWAVIVPVSESIFGVFLLTQFFKNVPAHMEEAALLDGCNRLQAFFHIFLPMARSSLLTLGLFSFVWKWNIFLWAVIALNKTDLYPLTVGLSLSVGQYETDKNVLMAGAMLTVLPILVIYAVFQRYIVGGNTTAGLK